MDVLVSYHGLKHPDEVTRNAFQIVVLDSTKFVANTQVMDARYRTGAGGAIIWA